MTVLLVLELCLHRQSEGECGGNVQIIQAGILSCEEQILLHFTRLKTGTLGPLPFFARPLPVTISLNGEPFPFLLPQ